MDNIAKMLDTPANMDEEARIAALTAALIAASSAKTPLSRVFADLAWDCATREIKSSTLQGLVTSSGQYADEDEIAIAAARASIAACMNIPSAADAISYLEKVRSAARAAYILQRCAGAKFNEIARVNAETEFDNFVKSCREAAIEAAS